MENVRNGNLSVSKMEAEIKESLAILEAGYLHKRAQLQLVDGARFIEMIKQPIYRQCKTVSDLKKKISEERNKLKDQLVQIDKYMPGHQFTLFEILEKKSPEEQREMEMEKERLLVQIRWMHKCLGMCSNRNYFK